VLAPDLVATAVSDPPVEAAPGARFPVTDSVKNQGGGRAKASRVRYYLSRDASRNDDDLLLGGGRGVVALVPGAISSGRASVTIPSSAAAGSYFLLACADDLGAMSEPVETNNCKPSTGRVTIRP